VKKPELRDRAYIILKTLAQERSFSSAKQIIPGLKESEIWKAISIAVSMLKPVPGMERQAKLRLYVDGASVPNPGPSGIGVVIYNQKNKKIKELKRYIGMASNNVAEYRALVQGLRECEKLLAKDVSVFSDSELLVSQMNGKFRVNDEHLRKLFHQVKNLEKKFEKVSYYQIDRNENRLADQLANAATEKSYKAQ